MTTMIALIGEQPIPNLLPIKHNKPSTVLLVRTNRTKSVSERLEKVAQNETSVSFCDVDPYDIPKIHQQLSQALNQLNVEQVDLLFNLTGGTKPMAFAAYQLAVDKGIPFLYLESEGRQSKLRFYQFKDKLPILHQEEMIPSVITIDDYLNAHLPGFDSDSFSKDKKSGRINVGGLFEQSIHQVLEKNVDEILAGVRPKGVEKQIEIDLVIRCGNQVGIIEVKTGVKKQGIDQLSTAGGRAYLGTYTAKFLIVGGRLEYRLKTLAKAREITVIELPGYIEGNPLIKKEAEYLIREIHQRLGVRKA
jgi:hypothetical protein